LEAVLLAKFIHFIERKGYKAERELRPRIENPVRIRDEGMTAAMAAERNIQTSRFL